MLWRDCFLLNLHRAVNVWWSMMLRGMFRRRLLYVVKADFSVHAR
jgi:hypothetical protein